MKSNAKMFWLVLLILSKIRNNLRMVNYYLNILSNFSYLLEVWKIIFQYNGMKSNLRHQ